MKIRNLSQLKTLNYRISIDGGEHQELSQEQSLTVDMESLHFVSKFQAARKEVDSSTKGSISQELKEKILGSLSQVILEEDSTAYQSEDGAEDHYLDLEFEGQPAFRVYLRGTRYRQSSWVLKEGGTELEALLQQIGKN